MIDFGEMMPAASDHGPGGSVPMIGLAGQASGPSRQRFVDLVSRLVGLHARGPCAAIVGRRPFIDIAD